jgi:hypothetical protein
MPGYQNKDAGAQGFCAKRSVISSKRIAECDRKALHYLPLVSCLSLLGCMAALDVKARLPRRFQLPRRHR